MSGSAALACEPTNSSVVAIAMRSKPARPAIIRPTLGQSLGIGGGHGLVGQSGPVGELRGRRRPGDEHVVAGVATRLGERDQRSEVAGALGGGEEDAHVHGISTSSPPAANRQRLPNLPRGLPRVGPFGVMDQVLLERDDTLAALIGAVEDAAAGRGSVVLVSGGAGIGKTSVVRAFAREAAGRARVLLSACDDLMAPRALGPLRDAALESGGPLEAAFADGRSVDGVFTAVLAELAATPPTALVVEDVHWADDATLDVLGYVARRIEPIPAVLVLTFRDDELGPSHPLQRLLGALAGRPVRRLALPPLSRTAVRRLAASTGADAGAVHRVTGGNPFFVTEVLASPRRRRARHGRRGGARPRAAPGPGLPRGARAALGRAVADPVRARRRAARRPHRHARRGRARRDAGGLRQPSGLPPRAGAAGDRAQPAGARAAAPERARPATRSSSGSGPSGRA